MKYIKYVLIFLVSIIVLYFSLYLIAFLMPKIDINKSNNFYLYDNNYRLYDTSTNDWTSLDDISDNLIDATISIEDKKFFNHIGFDYLRIVKAIMVNILSGETRQGASTITQQYAKNLYLDFDKTLKRKIEEAWITIRLEVHYTKEEILEGYLNTINYGGVFGIENASNYYFNKKSKDLTLEEATILAGIPKSPENYEPINNEDNAKKRQKLILESMVKNKYITKEQMDEALKKELVYTVNETNDNLSTIMYYQDSVIKELKDISTIPQSLLDTKALRIYTNLDVKSQKSLEQTMKNNLPNDKIQVSMILEDPNTGKVLAVIGGTDYSKSQYNRIYSKRSVGSTIKPLLYYSALENGFTPVTKFTSQKTTFTFSNNKTYSPTNFNNYYPNKDITLSTAIAYSDNIYAVKTHLFLGEDTLVNTAKKLGVNSKLLAVPSLALGSMEIPLIEMIKAYSALANTGYSVEPYFIRKVLDIDGNVLYERKEKKEKVLNSDLTFILSELLTSTYDDALIDYQYPTCYSIKNKITQKYAIKSGSTESDYLVIGYNKNALLAVWAGYDDNKAVNDTSSSNFKNMWADGIEAYSKDLKNNWYDIPDNVVGMIINPTTGEIATKKDEKKKIMYFLKGTEPSP